MTGTAHIPYLERRAGGFLYRRRIPNRLSPSRSEEISETPTFLRISLQTHVPADARERAARLTRLCDTAFALMTEPGMDHLTQDQISMLETLARFQVAAHAAIRAAALPRSRAAVEHAAACERATQAVLQDALATGNRDLAREPLRAVAAHLGVTLVEDDADWNRLAFEATRILLDLSRDREQAEYGRYNLASPIFSSVRSNPGPHTGNHAPAPFPNSSPAPAHLPIAVPAAAVTPCHMPIDVHLPMQNVTPSSDPGSAAHHPFHAAVMPAHLQAASPAAEAVPQPVVAPASAAPSVQKTRAFATLWSNCREFRRSTVRARNTGVPPLAASQRTV